MLTRLTSEYAPKMVGFEGSEIYEVLDDPDTLIEIADWGSAEAREALMQDSAVMGAFGPVFALLAEPFSAMVVKPLP